MQTEQTELLDLSRGRKKKKKKKNKLHSTHELWDVKRRVPNSYAYFCILKKKKKDFEVDFIGVPKMLHFFFAY